MNAKQSVPAIQVPGGAGNGFEPRRSAAGVDPMPLLDAVASRFERGDVAAAMSLLIAGLRDLRTSMGQAWPTVVLNEVLTHEVRGWVHRCPMTRHAFERPRGYAGDAELTDHIYGTLQQPQPPLDALEQELSEWTWSAPSCAAVRHRRTWLAKAIDQTAARGGTRMMALACGHLREYALSEALRTGAFETFTAIDQDPSSLAEVQRTCPGVDPTAGSVRTIINGKLFLGRQSLIYAAGLFDYLSDAVARRLVQALYSMLEPGGRLLIANFVPETVDVGYMESFMNCPLVLRNEAQLGSLFADLPGPARESLVFERDPLGQIAYVQANRD